jgi:hypothetical protein
VKKTIAEEKAKSAFSGSLTLDSRGASMNRGQFPFSQQADQGACAIVLKLTVWNATKVFF